MKTSFLILSLFFLSFQALGQPLQRVAPEQTGMNSRQLTYADKAIETAINNKEIPGGLAVLVDRQVGERHIGAFLGEFKCDGLADAAGCTRYDSHFSFE